MATLIYVATAANGGSDANDGTTPTDEGGGVGPKLTIQAAYAVVDAGGEVRIQYGIYDLGDGADDYLIVDRDEDVTFAGYNGGSAVDRSQIVMQGNSAVAQIVRILNVLDNDITFKDLTMLTATSGNTYALLMETAAAANNNLIIDNCSITSKSVGGAYVISLSENGSTETSNVTITDSSILSTAAGVQVLLLEAHGESRITNSTISGSSLAGKFVFAAHEAGEIFVTNCTLSAPSGADQIFKKDGLGSINFQKSTFQSGAGGYVMKVGLDVITPATNPIDRVVIQECIIEYTGATGGHCLMLGPEVTNSVITDNKFYAPPADSNLNLAIVLKGTQGGNISNNIFVAERSLLLKGNSDNISISNNTLVAHGTNSDAACITWANAEGAGTTYIPENCTMWNNICEARNGSPAYRMVDSDGTPSPATNSNGMSLDYNCVFGDILLADVPNATDYLTEATLLAFWATVTGFPNQNDQNSLFVDPQLDSNYRPQNPQVINGGKSDANGNSTSIGAIMLFLDSGFRGRYGGGGR